MDIFEDIDVVSMEEVHFSFQGFNISSELRQAFTHELDTVMAEIGIFLGIDLRCVEDEDGCDGFMFFDLSDECGVVYDSKISVEEE